MAPRHPALCALGVAGALALFAFTVGFAADTAAPAAVAPGGVASLEQIEAQAPPNPRDLAAVAASHDRVIALIETNTLQTAAEFRRASTLLRMHLGEFRVSRVHYELLLAAAALDDATAETELAATWDQTLMLIGRPSRFDVFGWAQRNPEFAELDPAPACVRAVWRSPAAARLAAAAATDHAEIQTIVDADQADRRANWAAFTDAERAAMMQRDKTRNARMRELVAAGEVRTANDFARAALVMQHSARFSGYQLAHELAVASLLLGDRRTGRWLAAATYDRMLRSAGLDQRFGTQMGPDGPLRVDETGICDRQRVALGCPTLAQARSRRTSGSQIVDIYTAEIVKPDRHIEDTTAGVSAVFPPDWNVASATPLNPKGASLRFRIADRPAATGLLYYRAVETSPPADAAAAEALLRGHARGKEMDRRQQQPDYTNRADSFVVRTIGGRPALAWLADSTRDGVKWSEYLVRVLGCGSVGLVSVDAPADQIESLRPAADAFAETLRLP